MLGYNTEVSKGAVSWGHITCGGTVANIEAIWAARNLKLHPLAVQRALQQESELANMQKFSVKVPAKGKSKPLVGLDVWEALNLHVDDVIDLTGRLAEESNLPLETVSALIKKHNVETVGLGEFMKIHGMSKTPVVITPASNHYSWPKGMTLLGLGDKNLLHTAVEVTGRQSIDSLKRVLDDCLKNKIPVITVVAVMGTTEEGAIDPIDEMFKMKQQYEKKGLTFTLHGDAAWGGYMCSMLSADAKKKKTIIGKAYVASSQLNDYSRTNLKALQNADSITIDPHKTGLIPYPAGGVCYRNGLMRNFVTLTAPVVFHGGNDPNIGVYGIEGSKPGASAVATLLSHRVIGMDINGYGRIMSQCISGAKLFYCMWLVVGRDEDPFTCQPLFPLPPRMPLEMARKFIKQNMLGQSFEDMMKSKKVADFLSWVGGDAMVNAFSINIKGNTDVNVANRLTMAVFKRLSYTNAMKNSNRKVPVILTQSEKNKDIGVDALRKLKGNHGLDTSDDDQSLSFLINTVLNPWMVSFELVESIGQYFRDAVLLSIGEIQDQPHNHGFISMGTITDEGSILGDHLPVFTETVHQYHAIAKFKFLNPKDVEKFRSKQEELKSLPLEKRVPVIFGNPNAMKLPCLMKSNGRQIEMDCFAGMPSETNPPFMTTPAIVEEVVRFTHFDMTVSEYPEFAEYLLFGDDNGTYLSHIMTMRPDMHQVVALDRKPPGVDDNLIRDGLVITIPSLPGEPFRLNGEMTDPLQENEYTFEYVGKYGKKMKSTLHVADDQAKIWTDFTELNVEHNHEGEEKAKDENSGGQASISSLENMLDSNTKKYLSKSKNMYDLVKSGFDPQAPVQPGDIVSLKGHADARLKVDKVLPDQQAVLLKARDGSGSGIAK